MSAEIHKIDGWRQGFNEFHLYKFSEIFTILLWNINDYKSTKKNENYFLYKTQCIKKNHFTIEIA